MTNEKEIVIEFEFNALLYCDCCGTLGAYDFMIDALCYSCYNRVLIKTLREREATKHVRAMVKGANNGVARRYQ